MSLMLYVVDSKVEIDLSDRTLTYYEQGEEVLTTSVAVGTERNPTPVGEFFVTDNVTLANPGSPWGPHAFGISARSDTITEYNGGDGIIGIHGTNRPASIGNAASLGCVRVPNEVITTLHEIVPDRDPGGDHRLSLDDRYDRRRMTPPDNTVAARSFDSASTIRPDSSYPDRGLDRLSGKHHAREAGPIRGHTVRLPLEHLVDDRLAYDAKRAKPVEDRSIEPGEGGETGIDVKRVPVT